MVTAPEIYRETFGVEPSRSNDWHASGPLGRVEIDTYDVTIFVDESVVTVPCYETTQPAAARAAIHAARALIAALNTTENGNAKR